MKYIIMFFLTMSVSVASMYKAYTEEMPPYNYSEKGVIKGSHTELLKKIMKTVDCDMCRLDVEMGPWPRSYNKVLNEKDTILYSAAKTPKREKLFKFVGPITTMKIGVIAKKHRNIIITNASDLNKYIIGVTRSTTTEEKLLSEGVNEKNLDRFFSIESQLKKMANDRIDMVAFSVPAMYFFLEKMGFNSSEYEIVYLLKEVDLYYAFNKDTNQELIDELNQILKETKSYKHGR